jgi:L-alanine-DL-glutamate epimerase-like enolase superfamily enzyme
MSSGQSSPSIEEVLVSHYRIPTDYPESDGTLEWDHTDLTIVVVRSAGQQGLGYTYAGSATATLIHDVLIDVVRKANALAPPAAYMAMWHKIRNIGRPGVCSMAISAVDCAIWDLKARLLGVPLSALLGQVRGSAPVYGSGGFTSYSNQQLANQFSGWASEGIQAVKMKIGRHPEQDPDRMKVARQAIGEQTRLYVDANGAYSPREALAHMQQFEQCDVSWFEEPVTSDDHLGMRFVRDHAKPDIRIAAGEYGYDPFYFRAMLEERAVDVLQADITRCGGVTAFMQIAALCQAFNYPLSGHTAPALHTHVACAAVPFTEIEYFHDHVRIERMFFDGLPKLVNGALQPDWSRPGNGLDLRQADVQRFAA